MWTFIGCVALVIAGYVASIYTWPWIRTKAMGVKDEIDRLEARIKAIAEAAKPK